MMGNEDYAERRQTNHTPAIALGLAAVLLLVVGALSYRDFVRTSLEKEYAEKEKMLLLRHGYQVEPYPGAQQPGTPGQFTQNPQGTNPSGFQQAPAAGQTGGVPTAVTPNPSLARNAADMQIESSLPLPNDPEISSIQSSLDQVREQSRQTEQRYRDITSDLDTLAGNGERPEAAITEELPDFLRDAVENPPGGNPDVEARLARMREQVLRAPSLAKVTSFDSDWGVLTFNAGTAQNVKRDQRFAVRRGADILGWVKVDEVQPNQSIAILVTNRDDETVLKPEVGDDLIDFELF